MPSSLSKCRRHENCFFSGNLSFSSCICLSVSLSVCLTVFLPVCLSVCLSNSFSDLFQRPDHLIYKKWPWRPGYPIVCFTAFLPVLFCHRLTNTLTSCPSFCHSVRLTVPISGTAYFSLRKRAVTIAFCSMLLGELVFLVSFLAHGNHFDGICS